MGIRTWKCDVCGYIHRGDEPPEICPVCGVGKELFSPFEIAAPPPAPAAIRWRCSICDHVVSGAHPPGSCPVCGAEASLFEPAAAETTASTVEDDVDRVIIVGGGIAGLTAAEAARAASPEVVLTLIAREPRLPYYRLNLTRLLAGELEEASLLLHDRAWFERERVELLEDEVTSIDRVRQEVRLRGGRVLPYDRLVLANGAHPFAPPIPGITREGVLPIRTLDDCQAILRRAAAGARCVCIGGGLLGLETAGALARRGLQVTVLEGFGWLLPRQLAEPAGQLLQRHVEAAGVAVRCNARAEELIGDESVRGVRLAGGEELPAELVVLAAGVRPNSHLARQAGLEVKSGVIVDDRLFTSDPAILAAGDVAEHRGMVYGIWPASYAQGLIAGSNAVGGGLEFHGLPPSNRLKVLAIDVFSIGQVLPLDASYRVFERAGEGTYTRLVCRDGQLVGANLIGETALAGAVKEAVEGGEQLAAAAAILARWPEASELCGG